MKRTLTTAIAATMLVLFLFSGCYAAVLKIDQKAPDFTGLAGVDNREHGLSDYREAKAVVVVFICNHCPVAKSYEDRLIAIQKDYKKKGVEIVAINSNSPKKQPQDSFEKMEDRAAAKDLGDWRKSKEPFNFPYLFDATQNVAKAYGATCTPHAFLLDRDRKVAYMGAVDDNMDAKKVKEHFLRNALDAVLDGKKPPKTETKEFGCGIKWDDPQK